MTIEIIVVHVLLAIVLFFLMNWIGRHSVVTARYYQISYFSRYDDAPAFNSVFRILAPVVYLVVVGAGLYKLGLAKYVALLYLVVLYQQLIRWGYLLIMGRRLLSRWGIQFLFAAITLAIAVGAYNEIIAHPTRLLPNFDNLTNELWLVVIAFLYQLANASHTATEGNAAQKERYLRSRYEALNRQYGAEIVATVGDRTLEPFVYAVLIYETFNRPWLARMLERWLPGNRRRSYGPMQVIAPSAIDDVTSVREGSAQLVAEYRSARTAAQQAYQSSYGSAYNDGYWDPHLHQSAIRQSASKHNIRSDYPDEVIAIHNFLVDSFYPDTRHATVGLG